MDATRLFLEEAPLRVLRTSLEALLRGTTLPTLIPTSSKSLGRLWTEAPSWDAPLMFVWAFGFDLMQWCWCSSQDSFTSQTSPLRSRSPALLTQRLSHIASWWRATPTQWQEPTRWANVLHHIQVLQKQQMWSNLLVIPLLSNLNIFFHLCAFVCGWHLCSVSGGLQRRHGAADQD